MPPLTEAASPGATLADAASYEITSDEANSSNNKGFDEDMNSFPQLARVSDSMVIESGRGSLLWDTDGNEYIDFASGVLVLAAGHSEPRIAEAISKQASQLMNCYAHDTAQRTALAEKLLATTDGDFDQAFFMSTGSEGIEAALKIARAVTGRAGVIGFSGAFHGKTASAVTINGDPGVRKSFGSTIAGPVIRALFPYPYRWEFEGDVDEAALNFLEAQIAMEGAEQIGAILLEPFLGAGGVIPASPAFLKGIRAIADRHGMVMILDEIQSGLGRGGNLWSYQAAGAVPDILLGAKHLGGGMPIVGLISRAEIYDQIPAGSLTSTFGGNPLSAAASLASLDIIESDGLVEQCRASATIVRARFDEWESAFAIVGEGRNAGLSCGIELVEPGTKTPASGLARRAKSIAARHGLLAMPAAGAHGNILRFGPALNIPSELLLQGLDRLGSVLEELSAAQPAA